MGSPRIPAAPVIEPLPPPPPPDPAFQETPSRVLAARKKRRGRAQLRATAGQSTGINIP